MENKYDLLKTWEEVRGYVEIIVAGRRLHAAKDREALALLLRRMDWSVIKSTNKIGEVNGTTIT